MLALAIANMMATNPCVVMLLNERSRTSWAWTQVPSEDVDRRLREVISPIDKTAHRLASGKGHPQTKFLVLSRASGG
jgi:hypothetical protein